MLVLPYRNDVAGDPIRKHKDGFGGGIPRTFAEFPSRLDNAEFLNGLEAVCEESNVLLGFDEVVTGFQTAFGGCREHYGITPDFATYGKAVAVGLPIGTVVGRNEIMNCFSGKDGTREYSRRHLQRQSPVDDHGRSGCHRNARQPRQQGDDLQPPHGTGQSPGLRGDVFCMKHQFQAQLMNAGPWASALPGHPVNSSRDCTEDRKWAERVFYPHLLDYDVIIPGIHPGVPVRRAYARGRRPDHRAFKQSFQHLREGGLF